MNKMLVFEGQKLPSVSGEKRNPALLNLLFLWTGKNSKAVSVHLHSLQGYEQATLLPKTILHQNKQKTHTALFRSYKGHRSEKENTKYISLEEEHNAGQSQASPHSTAHKGHTQFFPAVLSRETRSGEKSVMAAHSVRPRHCKKSPLRMNIWTTVIIRTIAAGLSAISLNNPHYLEIEFKIWMQH